MRVSFDPAKRAKTLAERGLDFEDAALVFRGTTIEIVDTRKNYGEPRIILLWAAIRSPCRDWLHPQRRHAPCVQHAKGQRS
jgi:Ribonuclease toxin, BrnT, of type II toxin-antitoxin system